MLRRWEELAFLDNTYENDSILLFLRLDKWYNWNFFHTWKWKQDILALGSIVILFAL